MHRARSNGATRRVRAKPPAVKKWWRLPLLLLLPAVLLAASGWGVQRLLQLPVQRIALSGDFDNVGREQIEQLLNPLVGEGFVQLDLERLQAQLQTLPWIYQVSVRRHWPGTLVFEVSEQRPIARWGDRGFLNHEGDIFTPEREFERRDLPLLLGPAGTEHRLMDLYQRMVGELAAQGQTLQELHVGPRGELTAQLAQGTVLVFGRGDIRGKLQRYVQVLGQRLARTERRVTRADLRYSNGVAVQFAVGHAALLVDRN